MTKIGVLLLVAFAFALIQGALSTCPSSIQEPLAASAVIGQSNFTATDGSLLYFPYQALVSPISKKIYIANYASYIGEPFLKRFANIASAIAGTVEASILPSSNNNPSSTTATSSMSTNLAFGTDDTLFIADNDYNRVVVLASADSINDSAAVPFSKIFGQTSYTDTSDVYLYRPRGIVIDTTENTLWVGSTSTLKKFTNALDLSQNVSLAAVVTLGGGANCSTQFDRSEAVAIDASGNLWVADFGNNRVLRFTDAKNLGNNAVPTLVLGQSSVDFCSTAANLAQNGFYGPTSLAFDQDGTLFVADAYNKRVMVFTSDVLTSDYANATYQIGQTSFSTNDQLGPNQFSDDQIDEITYDPSIGLLEVGAYNRALLFCSTAQSLSGSKSLSNSPHPSNSSSGSPSNSPSGSSSGSSSFNPSTLSPLSSLPVPSGELSSASESSVIAPISSITSTSASASTSTNPSVLASESVSPLVVSSVAPSQLPRDSVLPSRSNSPSQGSCGNGILEAGERCDWSIDERCCNKSCAFKAGGKKCGKKPGQCYKMPKCNAKGKCRPAKPRQGRCKVNPTDATKTGKCVAGACVAL